MGWRGGFPLGCTKDWAGLKHSGFGYGEVSSFRIKPPRNPSLKGGLWTTEAFGWILVDFAGSVSLRGSQNSSPQLCSVWDRSGWPGEGTVVVW